MLEKRIIPCLDFNDGRVVKGINFIDIKDVGDPVACAKRYEEQGADELVFLDITATNENRDTMTDAVRKVASQISIPLTVGGGIRTVDNIKDILKAGATKVSLNSAAVHNPQLVKEAAEKFGKQCIVVAIDVKRNNNGYTVVINGGKVDTGLDAVSWAGQAEALGAGEILLTSMDADGVKNGYDIEITKLVAESVAIPVVASGGCGKLEHFSEIFEKTAASAALAASLFHYGELTVGQVKQHLYEKNIPVRYDQNAD